MAGLAPSHGSAGSCPALTAKETTVQSWSQAKLTPFPSHWLLAGFGVLEMKDVRLFLFAVCFLCRIVDSVFGSIEESWHVGCLLKLIWWSLAPSNIVFLLMNSNQFIRDLNYTCQIPSLFLCNIAQVKQMIFTHRFFEYIGQNSHKGNGLLRVI